LKVSDPATAFRLPKRILATVDEICAREDLTRSQVFRRSVMEYLKSQNAIATEASPPAAQQAWPAGPFRTAALKLKELREKHRK
jgi:predicted transcriptional regulator